MGACGSANKQRRIIFIGLDGGGKSQFGKAMCFGTREEFEFQNDKPTVMPTVRLLTNVSSANVLCHVILQIAIKKIGSFSCSFWSVQSCPTEAENNRLRFGLRREAGGGPKIRALWNKFGENCDLIVYFVNSNDQTRFEESRECLVKFLVSLCGSLAACFHFQKPSLRPAPALIAVLLLVGRKPLRTGRAPRLCCSCAHIRTKAAL
jgi:hypothetical protein